MLEKFLIAHCAPTLAGIKTGSLFHCSFSSADDFRLEVKHVNGKLNEKGIYIEILRIQKAGALVLAYRPSRLNRDVRKKDVIDFLRNLGYRKIGHSDIVSRLKERLGEQTGFPHEIGLFLGYPLEDVIGFIENSGKNSRCSGCWKAYRNEGEAAKLFYRYRKCKEVYQKMFTEGCSIMQLVVAA